MQVRRSDDAAKGRPHKREKFFFSFAHLSPSRRTDDMLSVLLCVALSVAAAMGSTVSIRNDLPRLDNTGNIMDAHDCRFPLIEGLVLQC